MGGVSGISVGLRNVLPVGCLRTGTGGLPKPLRSRGVE